MNIIDRKTGKRLVDEKRAENKKLVKKDPIKRFVEKGLEGEELSPMDPPEAYDESTTVQGVSYADMPKCIQLLMDEHKTGLEQITSFEKSLLNFKEKGFKMTKEINESLGAFFHFFDHKILAHNRKEEKYLFQLLDQRLRETGEHSKEDNPKTAVDLMEDDHVKFIQLATLTFNFLGLAMRLPDNHSRALTFDVAYNNGTELIEMLKLHIFREDNTLFPLAYQLITKEEFDEIERKFESFNE